MKKLSQQTLSLKGFTLLEVMIAMVIFAVGLLGLAGIQALSLESSHSSYSRSQAVLLANEMVDRMKANSDVGASYISAVAATSTEPSGGDKCDANTCGATQMAAFDLWQWKKSVSDSLLLGQSSIASATVAGVTTYTVTVHWDEDRTGATGTTCPPASATGDLRCFQLIAQM